MSQLPGTFFLPPSVLNTEVEVSTSIKTHKKMNSLSGKVVQWPSKFAKTQCSYKMSNWSRRVILKMSEKQYQKSTVLSRKTFSIVFLKTHSCCFVFFLVLPLQRMAGTEFLMVSEIYWYQSKSTHKFLKTLTLLNNYPVGFSWALLLFPIKIQV